MATDAAVVEENEARLTQSKNLSGDCFALVDLHHIPSVQHLMGTQSKKVFDSHPRVSAWVANILARPAWSKAFAMKPSR